MRLTLSGRFVAVCHLPVLLSLAGLGAESGTGAPRKHKLVIQADQGGATENDHFGTHEFLDLCEQ